MTGSEPKSLPTHFIASDGWQYADVAELLVGNREKCSHNYEKALTAPASAPKIWAAELYEHAKKTGFLKKLMEYKP